VERDVTTATRGVDAAIIEGYAALDARVEGIAVYATGATTKRTQTARRATTAAATP